MRKAGALLFAAPVILGGVVADLARRRPVARAGGLLAIVAFAAALVVALPPARGSAVPVSAPAPVSASLFLPIGTEHGLREPLRIAFDQPMDRTSVAGALSVEPAARYSLTWDAAGTQLTVTPDGAWGPGTLYRVLVSTAARSESGGRLAAPLRSVVLTASGGSARVAPTLAGVTAGDVLLDTSFRIRLDRPVTLDAVRAALRTDPPVAGDVVADTVAGSFRFVPSAALAPDTVYRVWLVGLRDADGIVFSSLAPATVHTITAPVVRSIQPSDAATRVRRDASITVRFSEPMDPKRSASALRVAVRGTVVRGHATWSADARTLTFRPVAPLPFGAKVAVSVDLTARSALGADLAHAAQARFTVRPRPVVAGTVSIPTGGSGAVNGSWLAVERYYLRLMNCTRTGGWVTSSGACSSPGGRDVAPLVLNASISARVSRPYARLLATRNQCSHFIGGTPGDRLRAAGFAGYNWGENIGCRSGNPYSAVLGTHLFYQRERASNGGHYRNLMNASFRQTGIGVWVSSGRVRLVIDLYGG